MSILAVMPPVTCQSPAPTRQNFPFAIRSPCGFGVVRQITSELSHLLKNKQAAKLGNRAACFGVLRLLFSGIHGFGGTFGSGSAGCLGGINSGCAYSGSFFSSRTSGFFSGFHCSGSTLGSGSASFFSAFSSSGTGFFSAFHYGSARVCGSVSRCWSSVFRTFDNCSTSFLSTFHHSGSGFFGTFGSGCCCRLCIVSRFGG
jgi:hypothetical protein